MAETNTSSNNNSTLTNVKNIVESKSDKNETQLDKKTEEIANSIKAAKEEKDLKKQIEKMADKLVDKELDDLMKKRIKTVSQTYGDTTSAEYKKAVQDVIRGFKYAEFKQESEIKSLRSKVVVVLTKQLGNMADQEILLTGKDTIQQITPIFNNANNNIKDSKKFLNQLAKIDLQKDLLKEINKNIDSSVEDLDKAINSVTNIVGIKVNISKTLKSDIKDLKTDIASKLKTELEPIAKEQTKIIKEATAVVQEYEKIVKQYEESVQKLIKSYEQKAQKWIEEQETKMINTALNYLKLKL